MKFLLSVLNYLHHRIDVIKMYSLVNNYVARNVISLSRNMQLSDKSLN